MSDDLDKRWKSIEDMAEQMIRARSSNDFNELCRTYNLAKQLFLDKGDHAMDNHLNMAVGILKHYHNYDIEKKQYVTGAKNSSSEESENNNSNNGGSWWNNNSGWGGKGW